MNSIGNDIIALASIQPERTCQYRFYSKILSAYEQEYYHTLSGDKLPFEHYVWLLWSVKESAYKFLKRRQPDLIFSPTRIIVQQLNSPENNSETYTGLVTFQQNTLSFKTVVSNQYIHTIADTKYSLPQCIYRAKKIDSSAYKGQSSAVREFALEHLKNLLPDARLTVSKTQGGHPEVWADDRLMDNVLLSFSHDGNFVAYAFKVQ